MNLIKVLLVTLFVSCSCRKNDPDLPVTVPSIEKQEKLETENRSDRSAEKPDSVFKFVDTQRVQDELIDSIPARDTEKIIRKQRKSVLKQGCVVYDKKHTKMSPEKACSGLTGNPLTTEDAAGCSMHHWKIALRLLEASNIDSALTHCMRALSLYENGSVFYLKAILFNRKGDAAAALLAAEISLERSDHWKISDRERSVFERCKALGSLYGKYPSAELGVKLNNCQRGY